MLAPDSLAPRTIDVWLSSSLRMRHPFKKVHNKIELVQPRVNFTIHSQPNFQWDKRNVILYRGRYRISEREGPGNC